MVKFSGVKLTALRYLSLFSGIGGFDLGFDRAGMECAGQVECDPAALGVLERNWPNTKRVHDIKEVTGNEFGRIDVVCGGFPCQPHSLAGKRLGDADERDLWGEFARVIRAVRPRWVVAENTTGILSSNGGRYFGRILRDLAGIGYDAEWQVLSACAFGAPHTRKRVFIVAYPASLGREGELPEVIMETTHDLSLEALGTWYGSGNPFEDIKKLLGTPGSSMLPDGVPSTLAIRPALRLFGNAVVPQITEWIGKLIVRSN